jgi:predicted glycosyltransferase
MNATRTTAWLDLVSPSHPFFFSALLEDASYIDVKTTVRKKTETVDLAKSEGFDFEIVGRDFNNTLLRKVGIPLRTAQLSLQAPKADISLSSRNAMCILTSKVRGIPSIHFTDNDITGHVDGLRIEELYNRFEAQATHNVVPAAFQKEELTKWGAKLSQIHTYKGYKEDVYVANFEPDANFTSKLPFEDFVVIRPEALDAAYVDAESSLVPQLLEGFVNEDVNIVYLPRGRGDIEYADGYSRTQVYIPSQALDGLQLAWHSLGILTGSGTMAREAACMEKPAVSFFPSSLLSVDQEMVNKDMIFHSRDPQKIVEFIISKSGEERTPDTSRSEAVLDEVAGIVNTIIESESGGV